MSDHVTISRDPFARQELVRRVVRDGDWECDWCGMSRYRKGQPAGLFEYGFDPDLMTGRVNWMKGRFCCVACLKTYHDMP
jgi:hypothetical protein